MAADTEQWIGTAKPDAVILAAGKVGGITFNNAYPVDFLVDNLALPVDENSAYAYPRAYDLNHAISIIAAGKPVDEIHAQIFADLAICRILQARLLDNLYGP